MTNPPGLGESPERPLSVGGGLLFGTFNEQTYLRSLRDPKGLPIQFSRRGSLAPSHASHPVDLYDITTSDGTAVQLFLDMYAPYDHRAPAGFSFDAGAVPDLPRSLVTTWRPQHPESALPVSRRWQIIGSDGGTAGSAEWHGSHSVVLKLGPNLTQRIGPEIDYLVGAAPLSDLGLVLEDYFVRVLPIMSGGVLRGVNQP